MKLFLSRVNRLNCENFNHHHDDDDQHDGEKGGDDLISTINCKKELNCQQLVRKETKKSSKKLLFFISILKHVNINNFDRNFQIDS